MKDRLVLDSLSLMFAMCRSLNMVYCHLLLACGCLEAAESTILKFAEVPSFFPGTAPLNPLPGDPPPASSATESPVLCTLNLLIGP